MEYSDTQIKILSKLSEANIGQSVNERVLQPQIGISERVYDEAINDLKSRNLVDATNWRLTINANGRKALRDYYIEEIFLFLKSKPCDEPFYWLKINELLPTITNVLALDIKDDLKFKGFILHHDATNEGEIVTVTEKFKAYLRGDRIEATNTVVNYHTNLAMDNAKQTNYLSGGDLKTEANKIINAKTANANSQKPFWQKISDWIISNVVTTILVSLLVAYLVYRFGWNK